MRIETGVMTFENFDPLDNHRILTLRQAAAHSTNLVFIRLMRDITNYYMAERASHGKGVLPSLSLALTSFLSCFRKAATLSTWPTTAAA